MTEHLISDLTSSNQDGGLLAGMPEFSAIEGIVELREVAREYLAKHPRGNQSDRIRQLLSQIEQDHAAADHNDGGHQCNDRSTMRGRKIL